MATPYHVIADYALGGYWGDEDRAAQIAEHLTHVADIALDDESYSFWDLTVYVRPVDGAVLYATDSGCSCPMPFEDTKVSDLSETTLDNFANIVREIVGDAGYGRSLASVMGDVANLRSDLIAAGAK